MTVNRGLIFISLLVFTLIFATGCSQTESQQATKAFLEAYKASDQTKMDELMRDPGTLGTPYVISDLPESVLTAYKKHFVDFTYTIGKEEILKDKANVYVQMTYKDAGNPSIEAFNDYQTKGADLAFNGGDQTQLMSILEESFLQYLNADLETVEETIVIPLQRNEDGKWLIVSSGTLQNALTSNLGVLVAAIEELNASMGLTEEGTAESETTGEGTSTDENATEATSGSN